MAPSVGAGAGSGGYMLLYCEFEKRHKIAEAMKIEPPQRSLPLRAVVSKAGGSINKMSGTLPQVIEGARQKRKRIQSPVGVLLITKMFTNPSNTIVGQRVRRESSSIPFLLIVVAKSSQPN
jgi:hypothetical protein